MAHRKINYYLICILPALIFISCQADHNYKEGFTSKISHTTFFARKTADWSKVNTFKPIGIVYQPKQELMIFSRMKVPDTLHMFPLTKAEENGITKEYGKFRFLGAFEDHNLPPEFSHLMYINPSNLDVLQVDRMTIDAKGTEQLTGAILYMKDSINYMKEDRLFLK